MKASIPSTSCGTNRAFAPRWGFVLGVTLALLLPASGAKAFSLLGPYADWMDTTNSYRRGWDIGGPMDIGEEYRWNVPIVTYGFDRSFLDYFGSNGVSAVEQAIQILNDLPPASILALTNFPPYSKYMNYLAGSQDFSDLKSTAFALLVEQMGLAEPTRSIFVLRRWDPVFFWPGDEASWPAWVIPSYILERNFDPETLVASHSVNGALCTGEVEAYGPFTPSPSLAWVAPFLIDLDAFLLTTVADWRSDHGFGCWWPPYWLTGCFYKGLSWDDAGGLRYLLSSTNVNLETLLPDVHGIGTNATSWVDLALRPGVDKVTFMRQQYSSLLGQFTPMTNQFLDSYITNGAVVQQQVERVTAQPDFLFCASEAGGYSPSPPAVASTGTANWWNSATVTGSGAGGPGVIRPPVKITFNKCGTSVLTTEGAGGINYNDSRDFLWGSFDGTTNPIVAFPDGSQLQETNLLAVHLWLLDASGVSRGPLTWRAPVPLGAYAVLQTSTNLTDWATLATVANHGGALTWQHWFPQTKRFFRVVPL